MTSKDTFQDFLADELSAARWQIQQLEVELEQQASLRGSFRQFAHRVKSSLLFYARKYYHTYFSGLRRSIQQRAATERGDFTPYPIKYVAGSNGKRFRVLHAIPSFATGGSQQLVIDIIEGTQPDVEHRILIHNDWGVASYTGVPVDEMPYIRSVADVMPVLQSYRPDIVHVHYWGNYRTGYEHWKWYHYVFQAAFRYGCKVIENCNNPLVPYLDPRIDRYTYVSEYARTFYGAAGTRSQVIYPGSNFSLFRPQPGLTADPDCIGMVYRLDRDKLNEASIDVFISVVQRRPRTRVLIVGKGYYEQLYRQKVADAGLSDQFTFPGVISYEELPRYYSRMSVFVTPVHKESFGQVTPFAMNMGIAVAGYDVGALGEILNNPKVLVAPGDVDALATVIIDLLDDPERLAQIGRENQARAQAYFSLETMVQAYRDVYEALISQPARQ